MPMLHVAGLPIMEPPFLVGDRVTWNERLLRTDALDQYLKIWGRGPFTVVETHIQPDNFTGSIVVKKGKHFVYFVRPKDLKKGASINVARQWSPHDFRKVIDPNRDVCYELLYAEPFIERDFVAVRDILAERHGFQIAECDFVEFCQKNIVFVARIGDDSVVGLASLVQVILDSKEVHILDEVGVRSDLRGLGIGTKLVQTLLKCADTRGIKDIEVYAEKSCGAEVL